MLPAAELRSITSTTEPEGSTLTSMINETLNRKVRNAQLQNTPYVVVVGKKEIRRGLPGGPRRRVAPQALARLRGFSLWGVKTSAQPAFFKVAVSAAGSNRSQNASASFACSKQ